MLSPRSLRVRAGCIEKVKQAFILSDFSTKEDLAKHLGLSPNTARSFLKGTAIDRSNFQEICRELSLDWRDIADLGDFTPPLRQEERRVIGIEVIRAVPVWIGRDELLQQLKTQLLAEGTHLKVLVLVGQGGIGKTSLAAKLLEAFGTNLTAATLAADSTYDSVICFKAEEGSNFNEVARSLMWGLPVEANESTQEAGEKINLILTGLQKQRAILLLDNLETILHPPSHPQAGKAITPEWGKLLNYLVYRNHRSTIIVTSREIPVDLADSRYPNTKPDPNLVTIQPVPGVTVEAAMEILRGGGLRDSAEDLRWMAERVGGNVFLLNQLISLGRDQPGYLRQHPGLVIRHAEPMLAEQLARQSTAAQDLLRRMCVLWAEIDIQGLTFLRLYTDDWTQDRRFEIAANLRQSVEFSKAEIRETEEILERLVGSLVQSRYDEQRRENFYDLHPLIVEFLHENHPEDLPQLRQISYKFYSSVQSVQNPQRLADLRAILEAQYSAFLFGNYQDAYNLLTTNINKYLTSWRHWHLLKYLYEEILPWVQNSADRQCCLISIGVIYRDWGNWQKAEEYFRDALASAQEENNARGIANILGILGDIERNRGNWDIAERLYYQYLAGMTEFDDRFGIATAYGRLGDIERNRGNWDIAERLYYEYLAGMREFGDRAGMATACEVLGDIHRNRCNWSGAESRYRQCLEIREQLGDLAGVANAHGQLGDIARNRGNLELAESRYRQCLEIKEQLGDLPGIATAHGRLGDIARNRGNLDEAENLYQRYLVGMEALGDRASIANAYGVLGDIHHQRRNWDDAESLYQKCLEISTELGDRASMAISIGSLGANNLYGGNLVEAEKFLNQALVKMEELGMTWHIAETNYNLAWLERKRGNTPLAQHYYATAHQTFEQIFATRDLERIEQEWNIPDELG